MALELKSRTIQRPLSFNRPLAALACHGFRMFVQF